MSINIQIDPEDIDVRIDYWNSRIRQEIVENVARTFVQAFLSIIDTDDWNARRSLHARHLWATVLNIDPMRVGIHDHFFYQGGDSFTAMRLVSAANSSGFPVTVADVFRYPKLEEMAAYLDEQTALHQEANEIPRFWLWKQGTDTDL
ncbi:hypothetical protein P175DRAFT_0556549 [Aspergillus ochraceoroseus IBT 24754]|uniref:Carrier domain-containing protein n=1 Tax=Aspergillus ochraceoroseus IBT 24754 TaxID=1392256 RepID=A0A2T5LZ79_9EURO|nr:uncharacterized protein P175DRAFT_0556549 [Aspergillus ochraceoroseus IBT 24754]PTU21576.1 hypothetical protein P175DRAFT_0556549 [Aspergillus ochraceoroseus IBT 24754]